MQLSEDEWKQKLNPEQYRVLRGKGTEAPGTGTLLHNDKTGEYHCAACGALVFKSNGKYESTTPGLAGWPSFSTAVEGAVQLADDTSFLMHRTEATCTQCGSHLGHLFDDRESPSGQHYCINSVALEFKENEPKK